MSKVYYWLKLPDDFFTNNKPVQRLRRIAGGDTYVIIYMKLLLFSLKTEGLIEIDGLDEDVAEEIAMMIGEAPDNVRVALGFLTKFGLIEDRTDNIFMTKLEGMVGSETDSARRVRNYRQRQNLLQCNADVTNSNTNEISCNTEIEREKSKEKSKEIEKSKEREKSERVKGDSRSDSNRPTLDEIMGFCKENGLEFVDPFKFYQHYESKGWEKAGKWKAKIVSWNSEDMKEAYRRLPGNQNMTEQELSLLVNGDQIQPENWNSMTREDRISYALEHYRNG